MSTFELRTMNREDWSEVAELIHVSTNAWYEANRNLRIFNGPPEDVELFCRVYEALDPGCCLVAEHKTTKRIIGSCFYHPRSTHVSLGIMNAHPSYFGQGVARTLLQAVCDIADAQGRPLRLVSSAMNLDSYSLYNRLGFRPYASFQDMILAVPEAGLDVACSGIERVRHATPDDLPAIAALEMELLGIERANDYRYFLDNVDGIWHTSVIENGAGNVTGFLVSVGAAASNMLGPGLSRTTADAAPLILAELNRHRGKSPVWLIPTRAQELARILYSWGAKNCELHFGQIRGGDAKVEGVMMPTFLPETA